MSKQSGWFQVDKEGLAQVYARRGPAAPFFELISNAWDEPGVTALMVTVEAVPGKPEIIVWCQDDSTKGFEDLEEARVLFAPSKKKGEAEQRGRFNIGEKLFLSLCREASITSTGGTIFFEANGNIRRSRKSTKRGTNIKAVMRMTRADALDAFDELRLIVSPEGIETRVEFYGFSSTCFDEEEGEPIVIESLSVETCEHFDAKLQSEIADDSGALRATERIARVHAWKLSTDDAQRRDGKLYEMGIPVCDIEAPFDVNVMQKVPLTLDRDNVRPAFMARLMPHLLNNAWKKLTTKEEASAGWVTRAMGSTSPEPSAAALKHVLDLRFGKLRVIYDPSDKEGSELAMSKGYAVIPGGALPRSAWANVKAQEAALPAGQVTPSNRALFSDHGENISIAKDDYPIGGEAVCIALARIAGELLDKSVEVSIVKRLHSSGSRSIAACYGSRSIKLSLKGLGRAWFADAFGKRMLQSKHLELLIHELGHDAEASHLSEGFHRSQTQLGVRLAMLVAECGPEALRVSER